MLGLLTNKFKFVGRIAVLLLYILVCTVRWLILPIMKHAGTKIVRPEAGGFFAPTIDNSVLEKFQQFIAP